MKTLTLQKYLSSLLYVPMVIFILMPHSAKAGLSLHYDTFGYSGELTDDESGLQYLDNRYYSPKLQRFVEQDTFDYLNLYAYVDGNPIMNEDPSGNTSVPYWLGYLGNLAAAPDVYALYNSKWLTLTGTSAGFSIASFVVADIATGLSNQGNNSTLTYLGYGFTVGAIGTGAFAAGAAKEEARISELDESKQRLLSQRNYAESQKEAEVSKEQILQVDLERAQNQLEVDRTELAKQKEAFEKEKQTRLNLQASLQEDMTDYNAKQAAVERLTKENEELRAQAKENEDLRNQIQAMQQQLRVKEENKVAQATPSRTARNVSGRGRGTKPRGRGSSSSLNPNNNQES